jgi:hypothetical protein
MWNTPRRSPSGEPPTAARILLPQCAAQATCHVERARHSPVGTTYGCSHFAASGLVQATFHVEHPRHSLVGNPYRRSHFPCLSRGPRDVPRGTSPPEPRWERRPPLAPSLPQAWSTRRATWNMPHHSRARNAYDWSHSLSQSRSRQRSTWNVPARASLGTPTAARTFAASGVVQATFHVEASATAQLGTVDGCFHTYFGAKLRDVPRGKFIRRSPAGSAYDLCIRRLGSRLRDVPRDGPTGQPFGQP